jgi:hypothetical protein
MPAPITFRQYAELCAGVYNASASVIGAFTRHTPMDLRLSGFQGAVFRQPNGAGFDYVVTVAGTQPGEGGGADVVADAGFGGGRGTAVAGALLGPLGNLLGLAGQALLLHQCACAADLVRTARGIMGMGDRLTITGHSLGGGIAQIVSARLNIPAVGISAPAVTGVEGVAAAWARTRSPIVCLRVKNDPINHTGMVGDWLGRVVFLPSPRTGGDAHSIDQTAAELGPAGSFSSLGARDAFAT